MPEILLSSALCCLCSLLGVGAADPATIYRLPGFYDPVSSASHLLGAVVFAYLGAVLLQRGWGSRPRVLALGVYAASCVLLFSMSGVYHMMTVGSTARAVMVRLDHAAIFLLIAGTFTPAHGILFRGWRRWAPLTLIWTCAVAGVVLKTVFFEGVSESLGLALYLSMGWAGAVSAALIARRYGLRPVVPLAVGAAAYTVAALLEFLRWGVIIPGLVHHHELFHLLVLAGAFAHWVFIWRFADGRLAPVATERGYQGELEGAGALGAAVRP